MSLQPAGPHLQPIRLSTAYRECEKVNFTDKSFTNTPSGLFSVEQRPGTCIGIPSPEIAPVRTGRRKFQQHATVGDRELERRRRSIMCAYATCTGLLTPPYPPPNRLERTIRRIPDGGGALRLHRQLQIRTGLHTSSGLHPASRSLLATPTGHSPAVKAALTNLNFGMLPRCHTFAEFKHRLSTVPRLQGTAVPPRTAQLERAVTANSRAWVSNTAINPESDMTVILEAPEYAQLCTPVQDSKHCEQGDGRTEPAEDSATQVQISHISDPDLKDPMRGYEITMTDLMNVFYELDADRLGVVCLADFERLMLQLSFGPDAALRLFQRLDTDGDGALSLSDWTSEHSKTLAEMLCFRIIRQRLVGRNPIKAQMPTPSLTDQKIAMEMMLGELGVTAKTNLVKVQGLFNAIDNDGSGDIDGDELTLTVEQILRQKISKGVKEQLVKRFDKNGDGKISPTEFINKLVPNPMATLYAFH